MFLAIAWTICVLIAFIVYPKPDNLIVSYPVYLALGVDGVEQLSGFAAFAIGAVQVFFVFCIGQSNGRCKTRKVSAQRR